MLTFKQFIIENQCVIVTQAEMKKFETIVDQLFKKFGVNFDFTKHFRERMSDSRNDPCIKLKEVGQLISKIYKEKVKGKTILSNKKDLEAVLKDVNTNINIPVAIEYDDRKDELRVAAKTIMRKKNFHSPDPVIKV